MREIKFRGYDAESKRWRYGSYFLKEDITLSPICDDPDEWENDKRANEHHLIIFNGSSDWNLPKPHYQSEVNGDTVGQYTGLHDKNGKEIYEGDIVKYECETSPFDDGTEIFIGEISYIEKYAAYFVVHSGHTDNQLYTFSEFEVIGNIYENPELLESGVTE